MNILFGWVLSAGAVQGGVYGFYPPYGVLHNDF